MNTLLAHLVGDYIFQTHHQASEKTKRWGPAVAHAATYTAAYLPLTRNFKALVVIGGSHVLIDRYRLARHIVWAKNQFAPEAYRPEHTATGYPDDTPPWLSFWLLIAADNTLHLLINHIALKRWGSNG
jgi:hypothetical protein